MSNDIRYSESGAQFTGNTETPRMYRHVLWRCWDESGESCVFIGLNPSTADENEDDPTIRRCIQYAKDWGYGSLVMLNLFAFRATDPADMKRADDPVNRHWADKYLLWHSCGAGLVVAAWGNHGSHMNRGKEVIDLLTPHLDLKCFKITKAGQPIHPLYQLRNAELRIFANQITAKRKPVLANSLNALANSVNGNPHK